MSKIPVGATIAHTYRFAFRDFLKILGTVWAPWTVTAIGGFFLLPRLMAVLAALGKDDTATAFQLSGPLLLFLPIAAFLYLVQIAATVELALQSPPRQAWFRFRVGKSVWRLIGAYLLMLLVYVGVWIASILASIAIGLIAVAIATAAAKTLVQTIVAGSTYFTGVLIYAAFIYVTVRLAFLIAPVVVAEEKISLGRAGNLVHGNFWRLLLVFLATFLPFWLLQRILLAVLVPRDLVQVAPPGASPEMKAAIFAHAMNWFVQLLGEARDYWYIVYPLGLIWWVLYLGAICGAQSFAYRALAPEQPPSANLP